MCTVCCVWGELWYANDGITTLLLPQEIRQFHEPTERRFGVVFPIKGLDAVQCVQGDGVKRRTDRQVAGAEIQRFSEHREWRLCDDRGSGGFRV